MEVHRGSMFDVYRDRDGSALKIAAEFPQPSHFVASAMVGGVSTSWTLLTSIHGVKSEPEYVHPDALLADEHARIVASAGAWNHHAIELISCPHPTTQQMVIALRTAWIEGRSLAALSREAQRALWPRMLPAMWDALTAARHHDLQPSNILVRDHGFALIDPGAMVATSEGPHGATMGCTRLTFVTNTEHYPLLPPFSPSLVGDEPDLRGSWEATLAGMTLSQKYGAVQVGKRTRAAFVDHVPSLLPPAPNRTPAAADWLAIGIMYYTSLTGEHPWPLVLEHGPAWRDLVITDDHPEGHGLGSHAVSTPPAMPDALSTGESALATALLDLTCSSRERLVELVARVVHV